MVHMIPWHKLSQLILSPTPEKQGSIWGWAAAIILENEVRRPDTTLCPNLPAEDENPVMHWTLCPNLPAEDENPVMHWGWAEVEVLNCSWPEAIAWCRGYFALTPQQQAVLLIKVYSSSVSGYFWALTVMYQSEIPDSEKVIVEDNVIFSTDQSEYPVETILARDISQIQDASWSTYKGLPVESRGLSHWTVIVLAVVYVVAVIWVRSEGHHQLHFGAASKSQHTAWIQLFWQQVMSEEEWARTNTGPDVTGGNHAHVCRACWSLQVDRAARG